MDGVYSIYQGHLFFQKATYVEVLLPRFSFCGRVAVVQLNPKVSTRRRTGQKSERVEICFPQYETKAPGLQGSLVDGRSAPTSASVLRLNQLLLHIEDIISYLHIGIRQQRLA